MGVSALGDGCGQLHTINLSGCQGITDMGLSALVNGCGQLQMIDLKDCHRITNMGISALRLLGCRVWGGGSSWYYCINKAGHGGS
jgi:hypothetical protein